MPENRNAAWVMPARLFRDARYGTLFAMSMPTRVHPENLFLETCIQDAYPDIAEAPGTLMKEWSQAVVAGDWWVRDGEGNPLPGWSSERRAVDLGRPEPWAWLRAHAYQFALADGFTRIHWDDLSVVRLLAGVEGRVNVARWRFFSLSFMRTVARATDSINGGKGNDAIAPVPMNARPRTIKYESTRGPWPWGWGCGHALTWKMWVFGATDWGPGIKGLTRSGKTVIWDWFFKRTWTPTQAAAHAAVVMATALLFDNVAVMFHGNNDVPDWWKTPIWYPCCEWPAQLGEPIARCSEYPDHSWRREYQHGTVIIEKDGSAGRIVER